MQHCRGISESNGHIPLPATVRQLVGGKVDLWYFQSPKNKRRFVLCGELLFLLAIAFEADRSVLSYEPCESAEDVALPSVERAHLRAHDAHGNTFSYLTYRTRNPAAKRTKRPNLSGVSVITDEWLYERRVLLDNWIFLCAAINRVRHSAWHAEADAMHGTLTSTRGCTLGELLTLPGIDRARMLGAIGDALQRGIAECDTTGTLLTLNSHIRPGGPSWANPALPC